MQVVFYVLQLQDRPKFGALSQARSLSSGYEHNLNFSEIKITKKINFLFYGKILLIQFSYMKKRLS